MTLMIWIGGGIYLAAKFAEGISRGLAESAPLRPPTPCKEPNPWRDEVAWFEGVPRGHFTAGDPRVTIFPPAPC